jgi:hypothetical protein
MTANATIPRFPEPDPERRHPVPTPQPYQPPKPMERSSIPKGVRHA